MRPILKSVLVFFFLVTGTLRAQAPSWCFTEHLTDAIALNFSRMRAYSKLSERRTLTTSAKLIFNEAITIPVALYYDFKLRKLRHEGIPILCDELMPMDLAKPLQVLLAPPDKKFSQDFDQKLDAKNISQEIRSAYEKNSFAGVSSTAKIYIEKLKEYPDHYCMLRHFLESVARVAMLVPKHQALSKEKNLSDTSDWSWSFIELHLDPLPLALATDRKVAPLQDDGVRIICNDVPPIPYE